MHYAHLKLVTMSSCIRCEGMSNRRERENKRFLFRVVKSSSIEIKAGCRRWDASNVGDREKMKCVRDNTVKTTHFWFFPKPVRTKEALNYCSLSFSDFAWLFLFCVTSVRCSSSNICRCRRGLGYRRVGFSLHYAFDISTQAARLVKFALGERACVLTMRDWNLDESRLPLSLLEKMNTKL